MVENFSNLGNETDIQIQEAKRVPKKMNPKRPTPRHLIIKMSRVKDKEKILIAARKNNLLCTREPPLNHQQISQQKLSRPEGRGMIYTKC